MKKKLFQVLLAFSIIGTSLAGAFMEYFHARTEGENVRLEWKTGEEANLNKFVLERKTQQSPYVDISTINPKGNNSFYSFVDESVYKTTEEYVFTYRLRIIDNDQKVSYSPEASVSPSISGVKRTWGSIKAMFR